MEQTMGQAAATAEGAILAAAERRYDYDEPDAAECFGTCVHSEACGRLDTMHGPRYGEPCDWCGCGTCALYERDPHVIWSAV